MVGTQPLIYSESGRLGLTDREYKIIARIQLTQNIGNEHNQKN